MSKAALEKSTGDGDTSFDNQKKTNTMIEDFPKNGEELEKDVSSADPALTAQLTPTLAKQRSFRLYCRRLCFGRNQTLLSTSGWNKR